MKGVLILKYVDIIGPCNFNYNVLYRHFLLSCTTWRLSPEPRLTVGSSPELLTSSVVSEPAAWLLEAAPPFFHPPNYYIRLRGLIVWDPKKTRHSKLYADSPQSMLPIQRKKKPPINQSNSALLNKERSRCDFKVHTSAILRRRVAQ